MAGNNEGCPANRSRTQPLPLRNKETFVDIAVWQSHVIERSTCLAPKIHGCWTEPEPVLQRFAPLR